MNLFKELKRRNVFRVAIAYLAIAWLLLQIVDVFIDNMGAPVWLFQTIVIFMAVGFPFALFLAWVYELTPEGLVREEDIDRTKASVTTTRRKLDLVIIGVLVVALAYFVWESRFSGNDVPKGLALTPTESSATSDQVAVDDSAVPEVAPSIAVLPFLNISGDPANEYLSDGLTETLLHMLAQLPDLRVAARTSSFSFKEKTRRLRR